MTLHASLNKITRHRGLAGPFLAKRGRIRPSPEGFSARKPRRWARGQPRGTVPQRCPGAPSSRHAGRSVRRGAKRGKRAKSWSRSHGRADHGAGMRGIHDFGRVAQGRARSDPHARKSSRAYPRDPRPSTPSVWASVLADDVSRSAIASRISGDRGGGPPRSAGADFACGARARTVSSVGAARMPRNDGERPSVHIIAMAVTAARSA